MEQYKLGLGTGCTNIHTSDESSCRELHNELYNITKHSEAYYLLCRSRWLRGLRRGSDAAGSLGLWLRILPGACLSVCLSVSRGVRVLR